jgi:hypothetical protein
MGDTFKGTWHRPGSNGSDRQTGTKNDVNHLAHYDNEPATSYSGCLLIAFTILTTLAAVLGIALS